jgi:predicted PurR-regulated permease PerM
LADSLKKYWRLLATLAICALVVYILYLWRMFVLPFAVGLVLAYVLKPLVAWLEKILPPRKKKSEFKKTVAVGISFLVLVIVFGGIIYIVISTVIDASLKLVENAPFFFGQSLNRIQEWFQNLVANLPIGIQQQVNQELTQVGLSLGESVKNILLRSLASISGYINTILGFAVLPFFLFYLLKDSDKIKKSLATSLPPSVAFHGRNIVTIIEGVLGRYIRAQGMLGLIVAYFTFIGLLLLNVPFPLALALIAGISELVPTIGPWIGGSISVLVALAMAPGRAIWVAALFLGIQMVENAFLVPRIQSAFLRIHPIIMIVLLVFGTYIAGIWGLLLIGPLTATIVEIFKYVRDYCEGKECQLPEYLRQRGTL